MARGARRLPVFFAVFDAGMFDFENVPLAGRAFLAGIFFLILIAAESTLDLLSIPARRAVRSLMGEFDDEYDYDYLPGSPENISDEEPTP